MSFLAHGIFIPLLPVPSLPLELIIVSRPSPFLENFIHSAYPETNLPPLWQVIYQEAVRGHHLLFNRHDVEQFDQELVPLEKSAELQIPDEVETIVLHIVECADLQSMVKVIDRQPVRLRRSLYQLYKRVLWMWRHYVKDQLN